jgi:hypothetical protein
MQAGNLRNPSSTRWRQPSGRPPAHPSGHAGMGSNGRMTCHLWIRAMTQPRTTRMVAWA